MSQSKIVFLGLLGALILAACASYGGVDDAGGAQKAASEELAHLHQAARHLERKMPGPQVKALLGPPTTNRTTTCEPGTARSSLCRLWRYETAVRTRDLQPALTVYLQCEMVRKLDIARALRRQGMITDEDLAAYEDDPRAAERIELCIVDRWQWL